ncbi:MAG: DUF924 family protein [Burkholderiales bacterium]|jgi:uncharacterized protein (DUF924 family)
MSPMYQEILRFWFEETSPANWWSAESTFDEEVRSRYGGLIDEAARGELYEWRNEGRGRLAEIIVLDQFSRNVYRNTVRAFAQDPVALVLSQEAVQLGIHATLSPTEASFLLMPFMHSESAKIHVMGEQLFLQFTPKTNYEFERRHKAIVDRFGRYPHRNAILGRASTAEELEFLKQPGSRF